MSGSDPAADPDPARHLSHGIELFNAGDYLAAHEEFEQLWLANEGADADFFKGLVQACVAMHHFREGNLEGAARLHAGHRMYLAAYLPRHRGIDVAGFLEEMQSALRPVARRAPAARPVFDAASRPRLRIVGV